MEQKNNVTLAAATLSAHEYFATKEQDGALKKAGKFTAGTAITASAFTLAVVEAALSALAGVVFSPLYVISPKNYSIITQYRRDATQAAVQAAQRTFGIEQKKTEEESKVQEKTLKQKTLETLQITGSNIKEKATQGVAFGKEHKKAMIASMLTMAAAATYFFAPEGAAEQVLTDPLCTIFNGAMDLKDWTFSLIYSNTTAPTSETVATQTSSPSLWKDGAAGAACATIVGYFTSNFKASSAAFGFCSLVGHSLQS